MGFGLQVLVEALERAPIEQSLRTTFERSHRRVSSDIRTSFSVSLLFKFNYMRVLQVLFEAPGRAPILHSGDCRWQRCDAAVATLERVRGRCQLVLDTTYCNPQYTFPPQVGRQKTGTEKASNKPINHQLNHGQTFPRKGEKLHQTRGSPRLPQSCCQLVLDTTCCSPQYAFPPQVCQIAT